MSIITSSTQSNKKSKSSESLDANNPLHLLDVNYNSAAYKNKNNLKTNNKIYLEALNRIRSNYHANNMKECESLVYKILDEIKNDYAKKLQEFEDKFDKNRRILQNIIDQRNDELRSLENDQLKAITRARSITDEKDSKISGLQNEINRIQNQNDKLKERVRNMSNQNQFLTQLLDDKKQIILDKNNQIREFESADNAAENVKSKLEEYKKLESKNRELVNQINSFANLQKNITRLQERNWDLELSVNNCQANNTALSNIKSFKADKIKILELDNQKLINSNAKLNQNITKCYKSKKAIKREMYLQEHNAKIRLRKNNFTCQGDLQKLTSAFNEKQVAQNLQLENLKAENLFIRKSHEKTLNELDRSYLYRNLFAGTAVCLIFLTLVLTVILIVQCRKFGRAKIVDREKRSLKLLKSNEMEETESERHEIFNCNYSRT